MRYFTWKLFAPFSAWFLKENSHLIIFYSLTKFHCPVVFTSWDMGQCLYYNYFWPGCDVINLEINLMFPIKPFFLSWERKELLTWKKKSIFKGLSLKKQNYFFDGESPTLMQIKNSSEPSIEPWEAPVFKVTDWWILSI